MSSMDNIVSSVENLRLYYILPRNIYVKAVDGVSIDIPRGGFLGLVGESGSGKTTLAEGILNLIEPPMIKISGKIYYYLKSMDSSAKAVHVKKLDLEQLSKKDLERLRGEELSIIPQYSMDALNPTMKIGSFIKDLAVYHGKDPDKVMSIALERFKMLGLPDDILNRYPHELSGGMRQRTVVGISTLLNPRFLVADEPVSNLDVVQQHIVIDFLVFLVEKKLVETLLMVTHDLPLIIEKSRYLLVMYGGHIVETGSKEEIWSEPLHPYTKMFLESIPPVGVRIEEKRIRGIPGNPPDLRFPPPGCRFHPRCPLAMDICRREEPPEIEIKPGRKVRCWLLVDMKGR
ncbi:MAG: ABC transporter ATP-binding protein [Sulfolobales archaeon]